MGNLSCKRTETVNGWTKDTDGTLDGGLSPVSDVVVVVLAVVVVVVCVCCCCCCCCC